MCTGILFLKHIKVSIKVLTKLWKLNGKTRVRARESTPNQWLWRISRCCANSNKVKGGRSSREHSRVSGRPCRHSFQRWWHGRPELIVGGSPGHVAGAAAVAAAAVAKIGMTAYGN